MFGCKLPYGVVCTTTTRATTLMSGACAIERVPCMAKL